MKRPSILFVDDDPGFLDAVQRSLRDEYAIETAWRAEDGLAKLQGRGPFAVVVADWMMPGMDGLTFLVKAQESAPETTRIMLTGRGDRQTAIEALNRCRVFQFLSKPCPTPTLAMTLRNAVRQHRLLVGERRLLENTLNGSVRLLTEVLSTASPQLFGRTELLRTRAVAAAGVLRLPAPWRLEIAAMFCRIGVVSLPADLAAKLDRQGEQGLSPAELAVAARVPQLGSDVLEHIPRLQDVARIVRYHRKNFDGSGPPADAVRGAAIPLEARILRILVAVGDAEIETMATGTTPSSPWPRLHANAGWFDPELLSALEAGLGSPA